MASLKGFIAAKSGHPGGSLSISDVLAYLYFKEMNIDPANPNWPDRDRLVLSKGHTAPGLYSALANRGYFPVEDLKTLRHIDSYLQGHPDMKGTPGVDMSSGSLGQGVSVATGMALSAKISNASYRVHAILGDGELEEGQVWEAAMFAAHKKLDHLCAVIDFNNLQIDGSLDEVNSPCPIDELFKAFGWNVIVIDGHDFDQIEDAFAKARQAKGSQRRLSCTRPRARVFLLWRIRPAGTAPPPTTSSMPKPCRSCEIRSASWERSKPRGFLAHSSRPCRRDRDRLNFREKRKALCKGHTMPLQGHGEYNGR